MSAENPIEDYFAEYMDQALAVGQTASSPAVPGQNPSPEFKYIGRAVSRGWTAGTSSRAAAHYTHDLVLDDMLIGKILRSPHASADVVSVDLGPALAHPGRQGRAPAQGRTRSLGRRAGRGRRRRGRADGRRGPRP